MSRPKKPDALATRALIRVMLEQGKGYKEIIAAAHQRGLGCSTQQIARMKRVLAGEEPPLRAAPASGDAIMQLVNALRNMGVIEFHYTHNKVTIVRSQTLEIEP